MLTHLDSQEWRKFAARCDKVAENFYLGGHCACHGLKVVEYVRNGKRFEVPSDQPKHPIDHDPALRNHLIAFLTVQEAISDTWTRRGPFGPSGGRRFVSSVVVKGVTVFATSEGPIGYTSDAGGFNARVYPHLITAMWT